MIVNHSEITYRTPPSLRCWRAQSVVREWQRSRRAKRGAKRGVKPREDDSTYFLIVLAVYSQCVKVVHVKSRQLRKLNAI